MTESALPARLELNLRSLDPWKGFQGKPNREGSDDGKRASSAIEVAYKDASPLEGSLRETMPGSFGFTVIWLICTLIFPRFL